MTLQTIYIARHGYRSNWLPPPHPPNPTGIDSDPVLAPHGVEQAKELAKHVVSLDAGSRPQMIVSSPFYRCIETAEPIAKGLGLKIAIDTGIGEWFKKDRGVIPVPAGYMQLQPFFPKVIGDSELWDGSGVVPSSLGEAESDIFDRACRFWHSFIPKIEQKYPHVTCVLLVTHAAAKIALGMALMQLSSVHDAIDFEGETKLRAGACSLDKYVQEGSLWKLKENGRTDFLTHGEEMNWNFDVKFEAGSDEDIKARKEKTQKEKAQKEKAQKEKEQRDQEQQKDDQKDDSPYEEVYFAIDVPVVAPSFYDDLSREGRASEETGLTDQLLINPNAKLQMTELDHENPLFKISDNANAAADPESVFFSNLSAIDGQIYKTSWRKLLGTEMVFDDHGTLLGTVREHLVADGPVKPKTAEPPSVQEDAQEGDTRSAFLKNAIALAKKKEDS